MIRNFVTGALEYEIYTFSSQIVTIPVSGKQETSGMEKLAIQEIEKEIKSFVKADILIELSGKNRATAYVSEKNVGALIGKR